MGWFSRWRYRRKVLREALGHRLDARFVRLFQERNRLAHYQTRIEYLRGELEERLQEPVLVRYNSNTTLVEFATEYNTIAKLTVFLRVAKWRPHTRLLIRINPQYRAYQIWFQAAFAGLRQTHRDLKSVLTLKTEAPRE